MIPKKVVEEPEQSEEPETEPQQLETELPQPVAEEVKPEPEEAKEELDRSLQPEETYKTALVPTKVPKKEVEEPEHKEESEAGALYRGKSTF